MRWQIESLSKELRTQVAPLTQLAVALAAGFAALFFTQAYHWVLFPLILLITWKLGSLSAFTTLLISLWGLTTLEPRIELFPAITFFLSMSICIGIINRLKKNEAVATLAQQELETTLTSIGDAVIVADRDQKVVFMNPQAERLTGWKNIAARNQDMTAVLNILDENTKLPAASPAGRVLLEGCAREFPERSILISKDKDERYIEVVAAPINLPEATKPVGVVFVFRDVTEKLSDERRALEARKTLEDMIEEVSDGIVIADGDGGNMRMNHAARKMHGFSDNHDIFEHYPLFHDEFILRTLDGKILPVDDWPLSRVLRNEKFTDVEAVVSRKGSDLAFTASYAGTPISDEGGKIKLAVLTVRDVTKRALTESELRRAKKEAENASIMKSSFLANMSHEIRTPMTAILGFTEILRDGTLSDEERRDALMRIDRSGRSLLKLIDDILDVTKVESGKVEIQKSKFSPLEIASEVISLLRIQADQKGLDLRLKTSRNLPEVACSDPLRVRQILMNLVGNAVKFTVSGHVKVSLDVEGDFLTIRVQDTGIGIRPEDQQKLFQPFAQADGSITRRFGGTGLGLVLSRQIAMALGGSLEIESSAPGEGTTFVARVLGAPFSGTLSPEEAKAGATESVAIPEEQTKILKGLNILVAEDTPDNQLLIRFLLNATGVGRIDFANDGEEAVAKAMGCRYDLILMDIQMPVMDGLQATKRLRELGYQHPIVALTAHAMPDEIQNSLDMGCNGHVSKPITKANLIAALAKYAQDGPNKAFR